MQRCCCEEKHFHVMQGWTRDICQTESHTCDTSYEGLLLPLQSSSQEHMSAHTSTPAAGGPQHTGYTPPYLALGSHHETQCHARWKPPGHFTSHYQKHTKKIYIYTWMLSTLSAMPHFLCTPGVQITISLTAERFCYCCCCCCEGTVETAYTWQSHWPVHVLQEEWHELHVISSRLRKVPVVHSGTHVIPARL